MLLGEQYNECNIQFVTTRLFMLKLMATDKAIYFISCGK